jgi:DNA replication protein DnaC
MDIAVMPPAIHELLPPQVPCTAQCKRCENEVKTFRFQITPDQPWFTVPRLCPDCESTAIAARKAKVQELATETMAAKMNRWEERFYALAGEMSDSVPERIPDEQLRRWATMPYDKRSFLFVGKSGIGKTRTAFLIVKSAMAQGFSVQAISQPAMADEIQADKYKTHRAEIIERLTAPDLLLLDDMFQGQKNAATEEALFRVLDDRFKAQKHTIITTNYTAKEWLAFSKSPEQKTMRAIFVRISKRFVIVKHCHK